MTALARWARAVTRDPNAVLPQDVDALRAVHFSEREIVEATLFVTEVLRNVTFGRAVGKTPSGT